MTKNRKLSSKSRFSSISFFSPHLVLYEELLSVDWRVRGCSLEIVLRERAKHARILMQVSALVTSDEATTSQDSLNHSFVPSDYTVVRLLKLPLLLLLLLLEKWMWNIVIVVVVVVVATTANDSSLEYRISLGWTLS